MSSSEPAGPPDSALDYVFVPVPEELYHDVLALVARLSLRDRPEQAGEVFRGGDLWAATHLRTCAAGCGELVAFVETGKADAATEPGLIAAQCQRCGATQTLLLAATGRRERQSIDSR